jgi:gluconate 2-dehydrogenase gamma chain
MASRRESLKIIGAIGSTCAFPFSADELYGQHVHRPNAAAPDQDAPYTPKFFSAHEFETLSRMAEAIIPATDTPGAIGAKVPRYIDGVVVANPEHKKPLREGLAWLDAASSKRFGARFAKLSEEQQVELLTPLSAAVDAGGKLSAPERFFELVKNLTADGYYTSQTGLVRELGYSGNTALERFPSCEIPEH